MSFIYLKKSITLLFFLFLYTQTYSKEKRYPISIKKNFLGAEVLMHNNKRINSYRKFYHILELDTSLVDEVKLIRKKRIISSAIGYTGSILSGIFLEGLLKGNLQNGIPVGSGLLLITATIPLNLSIQKHQKKAIELYNKNIN